ncbi:MAG: efflux RND transporter periplasmic adaptor subunit [Phycisphaeraceae bacterium JB051]
MPRHNDHQDSKTPQNTASEHTSAGEKIVYLIRQLFTVIIIPGLIIAGGVIGAQRLVESGPKAERRERQHHAPLVDVKAITPTHETIIVHAMGTVIPAKRINLTPQVSGRITEINDQLEPGGQFEKGQIMLQIDPSDYKLAVDEKMAEIEQVQADYRIEEGQQAIAKQEYELLGQNVSEQDQDLILRKPQLQTIAAKLKVAQSQLEQAKLDLQRTTVNAPFNAMVIERNVNIGSHVTTGTTLTELVGTDTYWVQVSVPVDQLKWITFPSKANPQGSKVKVYNEAAWGSQTFRMGHVVRLSGSLEEEGRMAELIVAVQDPIAINSDAPPLLLDSYVRVEIIGTELQNVYRIPRTALQHGDQLHLYKDGKLDIRTITIVHRGPTDVLVSAGLNRDDMLVTSDISAPVNDMPLRTESTSKLARGDEQVKPAADTAKPVNASEQ